jgi:hypothetical protein
MGFLKLVLRMRLLDVMMSRVSGRGLWVAGDSATNDGIDSVQWNLTFNGAMPIFTIGSNLPLLTHDRWHPPVQRLLGTGNTQHGQHVTLPEDGVDVSIVLAMLALASGRYCTF